MENLALNMRVEDLLLKLFLEKLNHYACYEEL